MASTKERARWDKWYQDVHARIERQSKSIARLVGISTEAIAALEEIAAGYVGELSPSARGSMMRGRAQEALDRIKGSAASSELNAADSDEEPIPDPRSNPS